MSRDLIFRPLTPWTLNTRRAVEVVAENMDPRDREEIFSIRSAGSVAEDVVKDIGLAIVQRLVIEGFVAFRDRGELIEPVAVALATRTGLPGVVNVGLFGREGCKRAMPAVWVEMAQRAYSFGDRHGIHLAQVAMMVSHTAARRMARRIGGEEAFNYGPIGRDGQEYVHVIWRY